MSALSLPELVKKIRSSPDGVTCARRDAAWNMSGCPIWKLGAKSIAAAVRWIASMIGLRPWPAFTHHRPAVPSSTSRPSGVQYITPSARASSLGACLKARLAV